jgi:hypothetical protein
LRGRTRAPSYIFLALLGTLAFAQFPVDASAQANRGEALRVYLDCNTFRCDSDYFRTEINFVNWVRDRTLADIHLIITSTSTGGGGSVYTFDFIGRDDLEGADDQIQRITGATDTEDEELRVLTRAIAAGLARYSVAIGDPVPVRIEALSAPAPGQDELVSEAQVDDPWDFWVFEIGGDVDLEGEDTESQRSFSAEFDAQRTTPIWKFEFGADGRFSRDERELRDREVIVDERTNWSTDLLLAYTLAEHWSVGMVAGAGASTRRNQTFGANAGTAIEYSFYPYEEAPRRSLTARYELGVQHFDWDEETIYFETKETRPQQQVRLQLFQRQPWGQARVGLTGSQFLHDLERWNVSLGGFLSFRVLRGLNLNVRGNLSFIEDQLYISREGLSDEEILLGRFDRPTNQRYGISVGLSYEFGSIYNNVVNNRFGSGGWGGGRGR